MSIGPYTTKYRTTDKLKLNTKNEGSYIDVGDAYVKPIQKPSRIAGKQFLTEPPKGGQTGKFFEKMSYATSPYTEVRKYSVEQKRSERKSGFLSNDASKRDEFLITMREGQWKELLDQEHKFNDKWTLAREEQTRKDIEAGVALPAVRPISAPQAPHLPYFQTQIPEHLYDIGNTPEGNTPLCIKCSRDVFYCKHRVMARNGPVIARRPVKQHVSSMDYGRYVDPKESQRPEFAYSHKAKEFYDSSHLNEHRIGSW